MTTARSARSAPRRTELAPTTPPFAVPATLDVDGALQMLRSHGVDLAAVLTRSERCLSDQVRTSHAFVEDAASWLIAAGGKRLRPLLVALTGQLGPEPDAARLAEAGAVVELVHLATLYHDDVIDEAVARRGAQSANKRWNNTVAVLTGDYLFARASSLAASLGTDVTEIMAATLATLCEGQMLEMQSARGALPPHLPVIAPSRDHYLAVVEAKTASLIAASCQLGALLSGCGPEQIAALTAYGRNVGIAFQLADDILDITSAAAESGKTPGTDLREGVYTLPLLFALDDEPDGELAALLRHEPLDGAAVERALALLRGSAAVERSRAVANDYVQAAIACLRPFPDTPITGALAHVARFGAARIA